MDTPQNEGELLAAVEALTRKIAWCKAYRRDWVLMKYHAQSALDLQEKQQRADSGARDLLLAIERFASEKIDKLDAYLKEKEPKLRAAMREVDPDVVVY